MSWMNSADSVLRLQQLAVWITILSALLACCAGVAVYLLNGRLTSLRAEETRKHEEEVRRRSQTLEVREQALTDSTVRAQEADRRSEELQARIDTLEGQLSRERRSASVAQARVADLSGRLEELEAKQADPTVVTEEESLDPTPESTPSALNQRARERFLATLAGKPTGPVVLIADQSNVAARSLTRELVALLAEAGWQAEAADAVFQVPPTHSSIVAKSQASLPERAVGLSLALAVIDLMTVPAPVQFNMTHPADYLGVIVVPP